MINLTQSQITIIEQIVAEIDEFYQGTNDCPCFTDNRKHPVRNCPICGGYGKIEIHYTTDLNEIFRVAREWCQSEEVDIRFKVRLYQVFCNDKIDQTYDLIENNNPALALCCALVKAEGRWNEVEDGK